MGRFTGKTILITGATSGIGEVTAQRFAAEGAQVVVVGRNSRKGEEIAAALGGMFVRADVTREQEVAAAVDAAVERYGGLDCIFNNAGAPQGDGALQLLTPDALRSSCDLLLGGVLYGTKHAARVMSGKGGVILNNASIAGQQTGYAYHIYSALKAAVIQFTRTTAMELAGDGIRVNAICPGGTVTPIFARALGASEETEAEVTERVVKPLLARLSPLRRAVTPDDIAGAALWLASGDAGSVTGQAITVDGGATLGRRTEEMEEVFGAMRRGLHGE